MRARRGCFPALRHPAAAKRSRRGPEFRCFLMWRLSGRKFNRPASYQINRRCRLERAWFGQASSRQEWTDPTKAKRYQEQEPARTHCRIWTGRYPKDHAATNRHDQRERNSPSNEEEAHVEDLLSAAVGAHRRHPELPAVGNCRMATRELQLSGNAPHARRRPTSTIMPQFTERSAQAAVLRHGVQCREDLAIREPWRGRCARINAAVDECLRSYLVQRAEVPEASVVRGDRRRSAINRRSASP